MTTVGEALRAATAALAGAGLDEARGKAEWLLAGLLVRPRWQLLAEPEAPVSEGDQARVARGVARLVGREPLQYVLGEAEFHGRVFRCDPRALIPRPETEELVDAVLREPKLWSRPDLRLYDVGTGTGCIALTLALARPGARVIGIDRSPAALALARENAEALGAPANLAWQLGDLLEGCAAASADAVVSNPPYVAESEWAGLDPELREHEPREALVAGPTGLEVIGRLAVQAFEALRPGGRLWLEMSATQASGVRAILEDAGFRSIGVARDLSGLPRIASGRRP